MDFELKVSDVSLQAESSFPNNWQDLEIKVLDMNEDIYRTDSVMIAHTFSSAAIRIVENELPYQWKLLDVGVREPCVLPTTEVEGVHKIIHPPAQTISYVPDHEFNWQKSETISLFLICAFVYVLRVRRTQLRKVLSCPYSSDQEHEASVTFLESRVCEAVQECQGIELFIDFRYDNSLRIIKMKTLGAVDSMKHFCSRVLSEFNGPFSIQSIAEIKKCQAMFQTLELSLSHIFKCLLPHDSSEYIDLEMELCKGRLYIEIMEVYNNQLSSLRSQLEVRLCDSNDDTEESVRADLRRMVTNQNVTNTLIALYTCELLGYTECLEYKHGWDFVVVYV